MRHEGRDIVVEFDEAEAGLLGNLAAQLVSVLRDEAGDPALIRILPDAYPDDPEASAEFRRYTGADLVTGKVANAELIAAAVGTASVDSPATTITLGPEAADAWMRALTDLRLTVATRIGIESDDDEPPDDGFGALYSWLGELQWALIEMMDAIDDDDVESETPPSTGGPDDGA